MRIWKMRGAGNSFLVLDARRKKPDFPTLAIELCKLKSADGLIAVEDSLTADFRLHIYNRDGSRAAMCGNGARCALRFAWEQEIAGDIMSMETDAGILRGCRVCANVYRVQMPAPGIPDFQIIPGAAYVEVGVPHLVKPYPGSLWADAARLREECQALRCSPALPQGANVNFYTRTGKHSVRVLTYERGVEDYTLSCGTGCCAVAAVLWAEGNLPGGKLLAENRGGTLTVTIAERKGHTPALFLEGNAEVEGIWEL